MRGRKFIASFIVSLLLILSSCAWISQSILPSTQFTAENLAIVVNEADPLSVQIGDYYQRQRSIPEANLIKISFPPQQADLTLEKFKLLKAIVDQKTPSSVEGYVLTWAVPYKVKCMSITSAFAFGFNPAFCAEGCAETALNPYFNQQTIHPYRDFKVRPTMMLAATSFEAAQQLIDRGVESDGTSPIGTAYLMSTTDTDRNVRSQFYQPTQNRLSHRFLIDVIKGNTLENKTDVMFYFTGLASVDQLDTLKFRPGAIADHLTSWGGQLIDSSQMSSLRWLEAGATGSYGTVEEPCNYLQKFPDPSIVIETYLNGSTLLESYWRSVAWPGQGVFIGEPLARPFRAG
jgi:uncharacterized protein (TIGR03790 family)